MLLFPILAIGGVLTYIYFLPYSVACRCRHRNQTAIGVLCLLLGWTFIGWAVAMIWAHTARDKI
jgi:hypothetical protein